MLESSITHPTQDIAYSLQLDSAARPVDHVAEFLARISIFELPNRTKLFCPGYKAVLHIENVVEDCMIVKLTQTIDPKTQRCLKMEPYFVKKGDVVECCIQVANAISIEKFSDFPRLGHVSLRFEGKIVAEGEVIGVTATKSA